MPTLVVIRHAKSDWSTGLPDHDRPLAARGRRDAPAIGTWLAAHAPSLDLVVCSPARRARDTWRLASGGLDPEPPLRVDDRIYGAGPTGLLTILAELSPEVRSVALVGHNPTLSELVTQMSGEPHELKTSAIAVLRWPGTWVDAEFATATVEAHTARG